MDYSGNGTGSGTGGRDSPLPLTRGMTPTSAAAHLSLTTAQLAQLSDDDLTTVLIGLLTRLSPAHLTRVVHTGQRRLLRDFILLLPTEIALHIFSHLDVSDHARASAVSKPWLRVAAASTLWRQRFRSRGWTLHTASAHLVTTSPPPSPTSAAAATAAAAAAAANVAPLTAISSSSSSSPSSTPRPPLPLDLKHSPSHQSLPTEEDDSMPWQYFYRQRHQLESNLVKGTSDQREFVGHSEGVYCIQADERKLVSGSRDDTIRIWDLSTGRSTHTLSGHNGSVLCLEFNRTHLVTGSSDRSIRIWGIPASDPLDPMQKYTPLADLHGHVEAVLNLRMDTPRDRIISCSKDFSIRLWDWGTGKCTGQFDGHAAAVNAVQVHGDVLVSASGDKKLRIWDLRAPTAKAEVGKLEGHARGIACVAFDGRYVCSGSSDQTIRVWDLRKAGGSTSAVAPSTTAAPPQPGAVTPSPAQVRVITGHDDLVRTLQFSAADNVLVSGSYDESVRIWQLSTGEQMHKLAAPARVFNVQWHAGMVYVALQTEKLVEYNFRRGVDMRGILPPPRW